LRELALLHERMGSDQAALVAWDRICMPLTIANDQNEARSRHRGRPFASRPAAAALAQPQEALAALREVPLAKSR
jgi:hypothetical protein